MQTPHIHPSPAPPDPLATAVREAWGSAGAAAPLDLVPVGPAPCSRACPTGIQVKRYVGQVAEGRYEEALATIRADNPFAAVSGYLCHRPCETECALAGSGAPIPVRALKRLAARVVEETGLPPSVPTVLADRGRIAVVGGGPAGLTAARDLRLLGYGVTLFEASDRLGGLLVRAVPEHRLPPWALAADLAFVLAHGVEVRLGAALHGPAALEELREQGFAAVVLATGAPRGVCAALPGASGAVPGIALLERLMVGEPGPGFAEALVLGAGHLGVAVATSLARSAAGRVTLVHSGDVASLPADPEALHGMERAGVVLRCGLRAEAPIVESGALAGVRFRAETLGEGGAAGRPPVRDGVSVALRVDLVVDATARLPDLAGWPAEDVTPWGTFAVDGESLRGRWPFLFGAGEVVTGARSLIEAVAHGRRVAARVHAWLAEEAAPGARLRSGGLRLEARGEHAQESAWRHVPASRSEGRALPLGVDGAPAVDPAGELEPRGLEAARRCLRCGPCAECATCSPHCPEALHVDPRGHWVRAPRELELPPDLPLQPTRAHVDPARCRGCGLCEERCPYSAPRVRLRPVDRHRHVFAAEVDPAACRGCGLCVGLCPTGALGQGGFEPRDLAARLDAALGPPGEVV